MASNRVQTGVLVSLLVALGGILAYEFWPAPATIPGGGGPSSAQPARDVGSGRSGPAAAEVPSIRLEALARSPEAPSGGRRNPFRAQPPPVAPAAPAPAAAVPASGATAEQELPPPPPIVLRFVGLIDPGSPVGKIAVLSDGRDQFYGREGDIIDGRYRIVRIGVESIDMTYVDGRGAKRIPLSGG